MKISTILDSIDEGAMALPEFQRGYVWNRDQVRGLMDSLYRKYPVGSLLVWLTRTEHASARSDAPLQPGTVKLLLDGQQRITSLYGIIRGKPPRFFDGNTNTFTRLCFNLEDETFEFYAQKMKDNPLWINVTELMQRDIGEFITRMMEIPECAGSITLYINRLSAITGIRDINLHVEEVSGEDKTVDVVVNIFNKVNSGGTKLSKGDLALAKICAGWPNARQEMKSKLSNWEQAGFNFDLDWLLRNITTTVTGRALFSGLADVESTAFRDGLSTAVQTCDTLLNTISGRLGLDHDRVLGGRYAFPVMSRFLARNGKKFSDSRQRDKLLYWYVHTFLWGRFTGSTESFLNQDLTILEEHAYDLDPLIDLLRRWRGDLVIRPDDFGGWSLGARFYPMLYLLTRVCDARDWGNGLPLSANLKGKLNQLQVHHIFPKTVLYNLEYGRDEVNAVANYCFLTQDCNLQISNKEPEQYFEQIEARYPGALASQWIPMDRELWKTTRYLEFLEARKTLLANAANTFMDSLLAGTVPNIQVSSQGGIVSDDELNLLIEVNEWVTDQGLPEGELMYEVIDERTGKVLALLDLAWPNGLQEGLSQPVALIIDEGYETEQVANAAGFRSFTKPDAFKEYIQHEVLAEKLVMA